LNEDGSFMVINHEDGLRVYFYNQFGFYHITSPVPVSIAGFYKGRLSGNYLLCTNLTNDLSVYHYNGSAWLLQQKISSLPVSSFDITNGSNLYFHNGTTIYKWTRDGTNWTQTSTITNVSGTISKLVAKDTIMVSLDSTSKTVVIYENGIEVSSITDLNLIDVCTNGTQVFYTSTDAIRIISKTISDIWTRQAVATVCNGAFSCAANQFRLVIGRPTQGGVQGLATVYEITTYENTIRLNNQIKIDEEDLVLTSQTGSIDLIATIGGVDINGTLTTSGIIKGPNGGVANPAYSFSIDPSTGIYRSGPGVVDIALAGTNRFKLTSSSLSIPKVVSTGPYYKLNLHRRSAGQAIVGGILNSVSFSTDELYQIVGLNRSEVAYPGAAAGSRFINDTGVPLILNISWSVLSSGAAGQYVNYLTINGDENNRYGTSSNVFVSDGFATNSSCIINLANDSYFDIMLLTTVGINISGSAPLASSLQIYSLN